MKSLHDKEINLEEPKDGFVLSLPTFGRNVSQIKNISSAHMDSMIHMCFLREKFSFDIWEKYMNHIFYDEFLAFLKEANLILFIVILYVYNYILFLFLKSYFFLKQIFLSKFF